MMVPGELLVLACKLKIRVETLLAPSLSEGFAESLGSTPKITEDFPEQQGERIFPVFHRPSAPLQSRS
jgi:hypothetical protein